MISLEREPGWLLNMPLLDPLATTGALAEIFSDLSAVNAMLQFEVALARAEAEAGIIPTSAAEAIARAAQPEAFDAAEITMEARESGTVVVPLVARLTRRVSADDPVAAAFVHRGATSQDVCDTALVLCLVQASRVLAADHQRLVMALRRLSDDHASTLMLARTLLQPAVPTTLGLKAAGWFGAISRSGERLFDAFESARVLQLGGAAGTLAAFGSQGIAVAAGVARQLDVAEPDAPWHVHRDRLAWLVAACGVYAGCLGKIARDLSLLMQPEIGEAAEPGGSSSTMPHKRNPAACAIALTAANRVPGLVAAYLAAMPQEHERGLGNWHSEAGTMSAALQLTGSALVAMVHALEHLQVDAARMQANIDGTRGVIFAEAAVMMLVPTLGRTETEQAIQTALRSVRAEGATFVEALLANAAVRRALSDEQRSTLATPQGYLGVAETLRRRLLGGWTSGSSGE